MTYEPLMALINDVGGFGADCPQGTEAASYHNAGNGLKSRVSQPAPTAAVPPLFLLTLCCLL